MVKPLLFKGERKVKKRKRLAAEEDDRLTSASTSKSLVHASNSNTAADEDEDNWVMAEVPTDVAGPIIVILPSSPATCIACDANGKVYASVLENLVDGDPSTAEPHDVRQVWIANRVAGTESFSFKGHHGRYLGCDKFGMVSATKEAISPEESFLCVPAPDSPGMFAVQTYTEKFLAVGESKDMEIRGDADDIKFNNTFRIRMQARFKPRLKKDKEEKAREKISRKELEVVVGRRLEDEEVKILKKARKEGNYHEAILDVKVKGKHDKFA